MLNFHVSQLFDWVDNLILSEKNHHWVHKVIKGVGLKSCYFIKHLPNVERKFLFIASTVVNEGKAWILRLLSNISAGILRLSLTLIFHRIVTNDNIESLGCISQFISQCTQIHVIEIWQMMLFSFEKFNGNRQVVLTSLRIDKSLK